MFGKRIACALVLPALLAFSAFTGANTSANELSTNRESVSKIGVWLVEFEDQGLLHYRGDIPGLRATSPQITGQRVDRDSPDVQAFLARADQILQARSQEIAGAVGRTPDITHEYRVTHMGMAIRLTPDEADAVRGLPGVVSVIEEPIYELATDIGPTFIGAPAIWDGSGTPTGAAGATLGHDIIVGIADGGLNNPGHPSFTDMGAECGYATPEPKLIERLDCTLSNCTGPAPGGGGSVFHGVHVASTAAGRFVEEGEGTPAPDRDISGVAPCAKLITYMVCPDSCPGAAIQAAIDRMPLDNVDVANFSLGPGGPAQFSPWSVSEGSLRYLDLTIADIFVAVAAGNTRAAAQGGPEDPVGNVKSTGPWVTTVANTTHSGTISSVSPTLTIHGPGTVPPEVQSLVVGTSSTSANLVADLNNVPLLHHPANIEGCTASGGFPAGLFTGGIALVSRGTCTFEEKVNNAAGAGAAAVVIYNNAPGPINPGLGGATTPTFTLLQVEGNALVSFINSAGAPADATLPAPSGTVAGDVLNGGSLKGPANFTDGITKPDIAAPGSNIYAAGDAGFITISGTSMASPHIAGSAALVRAVHPDWTPAEVKSAMMLTAHTQGFKPNAASPWDADDVGNGRVNLSVAALSGLVMDIPTDRYLHPDVNPLLGGNPTILNLPSMRSRTPCQPTCTWTRTVRNTLTSAADWTATSNPPAGTTVTVTPNSFSFTGDTSETQELTIELTVQAGNVFTGQHRFGDVVLSEDASAAPDARMTIAVQGDGNTVFRDGFE